MPRFARVQPQHDARLMQMQCACLPFLVKDARLFADLCYELTAASTN